MRAVLRDRFAASLGTALACFGIGCGSCGHTTNAISCTSDALCPNGDYCASGACTACPTTCQTTEACVNGECIPASCGTQACPKGQGCVNNQCVDATCLTVTCPTGQSCASGQCYPADCAGAPCLPDEICSGSQCTLTSCVGITCNSSQICADGQCFPTACNGNNCAMGTACVSNVCVDIHCVGVTCPNGTLCVTGNCLPTSCNGTPCPVGDVCVSNSCVSANGSDAGQNVDAGRPDAGPSGVDASSGTDSGAGLDAGGGIDAGAGPDAGFAVLCDGGPSCNINGGDVTCAGVNPNNACQVCDPAVSTTGWTNLPNGTSCGTAVICAFGKCLASCDIAGNVYPSGKLNPGNPCQSCQPAVSTSSWSNVADGTSCGTGLVCSSGACGGGCYINNTSYMSGTYDPTNACHVCNPSNSTTSWTLVSDGTACAVGEICVVGTCTADCDIGGTIYTGGTVNPANPCQLCQPSGSTSNWSNVTDGTSCEGSGTCRTGDCTCPSGFVTCGNQCVDTNNNGANCGNCGMACPAHTACFGGTCQKPAVMPTPRSGLAAATGTNGFIYAIGGGIVHGWYGQMGPPPVTYATNEAFDPATNSWATMAPLLTSRAMLAAVRGADGRIYTFGGWNGTTESNAVEIYDTASNTWTAGAFMPTARHGLAASLGHDGKIYVAGGGVNSFPSSVLEVYDPMANSWSTSGNCDGGTTTPICMPGTAGGIAGATGLDGHIYVFGQGLFNGACTESGNTFNYNPTANSWTSVNSSQITPRTDLAGVAGLDGRMYSIGGSGFCISYYNNQVESFLGGATSWGSVPSLPLPVGGLAAATGLDGRIFVVGGQTNVLPDSGVQSSAFLVSPAQLEVFDPAVQAWAP
jgi:hypothetical protein